MADPTLERLQQFITECNKSNSINDKVEVIKKYPDLKEMFAYIYDKVVYTYGITSDKLIKLNDDFSIKVKYGSLLNYKTIQSLLMALNAKEVTGHEAANQVRLFIEQGNEEYRQLVYNILDRNIETRTSSKLINKVFPGCISSPYVSLATDINEYDPEWKKINFNDKWWASRKLDGVRCTVLIDWLGNIKIMSRSGAEFFTLNVLKEAFEDCGLINVALDGECCIVENGVENFQKMMEVIRRKNYTIPNPRYHMFDMIDLKDFLTYHSDELYETRLMKLQNYFASRPSPYYTVLDQTLITSREQLEALQQKAQDNGWEGLIIRNNSPHDEGRSNNMLKLKKFYDAEFIVKDVEMGPFRYIKYDANGKSYEATETMLSAVMVEYEGNIVRVGSGFSIPQRQEFYKDPSKIIGKEICVKYFEVSKDKNGKLSLRFPTVKTIYDKPRNGI